MFNRPHHLCLALLGGIALCLAFLLVGPQGMAPLLAVAGALGLLVVGWALYRKALYRQALYRQALYRQALGRHTLSPRGGSTGGTARRPTCDTETRALSFSPVRNAPGRPVARKSL